MDYKDILVKHLIKVDNSICFSNPHYVYKLEDSVQHKSLITKDYKDYRILVKNQKEHSYIKFKKLQRTFDINKIDKIKLEWSNDLKKYIVLDGCHRLAIMLFNNIKLKDEYFGIN